MIRMQPVTAFLFSVKYYKTVMVLIGQIFRLKKLFAVFLWLSYFLATMLLFGVAYLLSISLVGFKFYDLTLRLLTYLELGVGFFSSIFLLCTLVLIK